MGMVFTTFGQYQRYYYPNSVLNRLGEAILGYTGLSSPLPDKLGAVKPAHWVLRKDDEDPLKGSLSFPVEDFSRNLTDLVRSFYQSEGFAVGENHEGQGYTAFSVARDKKSYLVHILQDRPIDITIIGLPNFKSATQ